MITSNAAAEVGGPDDDKSLVIFQDSEAPADELAFDEMNLVELPFALLTRDTRGVFEIPLSPDGKSRLACLNSSEHGLPNSLAPRVVLGLLWLWKSERNNGAQTFNVKVRELVKRYMYPDRFTTYAPNSELLRAVERQINCIANSRIHTDRWYDHKLKARQRANVAIISDVKVLDEGGRHRPRVLQVTWGQAFWESIVRRYTKPIDVRVVQALVNPLDLALYRLLDRQLTPKCRQSYADIVALARFKLGMRGKTLDVGGRTASSYVAKKLGESLRRLRQEQFTVRMVVDRGVVPYAVTFERIADAKPGQPHEVVDDDAPADLVREFLFHCHGVPRDQRVRVTQADRDAAGEWMKAYGLEKGKWMVERCAKIQRERHRDPILVFRGLHLYENLAAGAYERERRNLAQNEERHHAAEQDALWLFYQRKLVAMFDANTDRAELAVLEAEVDAELRREVGEKPAFIAAAYRRARVRDLKLARMNVIGEREFRAYTSAALMRAALASRHGVDVLAEVDGEAA